MPKATDGYASLSPNRKLEYLTSEDCPYPQSLIRSKRKKIVNAIRQVRSAACSAPLVDEFAESGRPFPPPAEHSPMEHPDIVLDKSEFLQFFPASYLTDLGATFDVVAWETERRRDLETELTSKKDRDGMSPSAAAAWDAMAHGTPLAQLPLLTEDDRVLRQQIDRYIAGGNTSLSATNEEHPTCPDCGIPMAKRLGRPNPNSMRKHYFWGCRNHPKCLRTIQIAN